MKASPLAKKRSGGRVRDGHATRKRILLAAEKLFAEHGFDGVSMRSLAAAGDAQLASLHYHFGSKLDLYRAIWVYRFHDPILKQAVSAWSDLDYSRPAPDVVRVLVERYLSVPLKLAKTSGSTNFLVILSREGFDPKASERGLIREFVEPAQKVIESAFAKALPKLSRQQVALGGALMAATVQVSLPDGEVLIGGGRSRKISKKRHALQAATIDFIVGGWLQLLVD